MLSLHRAEYLIMQARVPGRRTENFGVLLRDPESDRLHLKLRTDPALHPEEAEMLAELPAQFQKEASESGSERLFSFLEEHSSSVFCVTDRVSVVVRDFEMAVERLYEQHVARGPREVTKINRSVTHVPLYSLRAAAGRFGQDMEVDVEPEGWVKAPAGVRAAPDFYAVHVTGHSMEPEIPDGSVAVFKFQPAGSRQGKRVLVWRRGASGEGGEFTVKVYESEKLATEDGSEHATEEGWERDGWEHRRIRLKPLNPEYPVLELDDESEYRVLGELVGLLGIDEL